MNKAVYLDYNATTPVDPIVLESMLPYFSGKFGNAASRTHAFGWVADEAVEMAREQVAAFIGAEQNEVVFTSGATESINLAIKGVFEAYIKKGNHIITLATEHKAVLDTCKHLEQMGARITLLPVQADGLLNTDLLREHLNEQTILVCVMLANNETGIIQPMKEISAIVHEKNCILMSDATQACSKIPVDVNDLGIDLMTLSAHKIYGPKGCGALYVRRRDPRVKIIAQMDGGGHENGRRSGTLNVPGIVGLGKAAELSGQVLIEDSMRISGLRNQLEDLLLSSGSASVHGNKIHRLPNTSNMAFHGINSAILIKQLTTIAVATGSACTSALQEASHVLKAMSIPDEVALSSIRFSLGRYSTSEEVEYAVEKILHVIKKIHRD